MSAKQIVVVGEGWAALGAVAVIHAHGQLTSEPTEIIWVVGTGARMIAPVATLEASSEEQVDGLVGHQVWETLARHFSVPAGDWETGSFLREFRNKAFREPVWTKAPTPESRKDVRDETLWEPERVFAPIFEGRFSLPLGDLEENLRAQVCALPGVRRIEEAPVTAIHARADGPSRVELASGESFECAKVVFADRWSSLAGVEGLPKRLAFMRGREPVGALQAIFTHKQPVTTGLRENFFAALHKEAGEEVQRHVWGYFLREGACSVWTLYLAFDEAEDNHEIGKKLRRMKQALDKIFAGPEWLPEGCAEFMANVSGEQVRYEEGVVLSAGLPPQEALHLPKHPEVMFLTDGYGPARALQQVALSLPEEWQALCEADRASRAAEREAGAADELHVEGTRSAGLVEANSAGLDEGTTAHA